MNGRVAVNERALGGGWWWAIGGGLLLAAATPPAWFPGAEFLVVAGLAAWFTLAVQSPRAKRYTYLLGCLHMAMFSWSTRHIFLPAYFAIVLLGGVYYVLGTIAMRALPRRLQVLGFAIAVAACAWLRAVMPEIHYPHGQPCHSLWQWPRLLGALAFGGEPLANALLGGLAAALVQLWCSWRIGVPAWRAALIRTGVVLGVWLACCLGAGVAASPSGKAKVAIAAIEPDVHPADPYVGLSAEDAWRRAKELFEQRLVEPTRRVLGEPEPPDLILWPESSLPTALSLDRVESGEERLLGRLFPAVPRTRLLIGVNLDDGVHDIPGALLLGTDGRMLGHHEKQCLVPGGEFLPLAHLLPTAARTWFYEKFKAALGSAPDCVPGRSLPPLHTVAGVPFGALLCYDNAFPEPAARQVAAGAQFLSIISNEAWFRRGDELVQLGAMTVCRAIELATPIVRCTTDGWTMVVGADGRVLAQLPIPTGPVQESRILQANVPLDPDRQRPMAWPRTILGPGLAGLLGLALLHGFATWARLRVARTAATKPECRGGPRPSG